VEKLLSLKAAAKLLDIGERTLRDLCMKSARGEPGGIKSAKIGRDWRIKPQDLDEFVDAHYPAANKKRRQRV
jgi:excisionase family DNA binding protein